MRRVICAGLLLVSGALCGQDAPWPTPPLQKVAWVPPAGENPPKLVSAVKALFAMGLPDPRGCAYLAVRPADVSWIDVQRSGGKYSGWLLPPTPGSTQRHAIMWDGLIYPVDEIGPARDVLADTATLLKEDDDGRFADPDTDDERDVRVLGQMKVVLLLRLGHRDAAMRLWSRLHADDLRLAWDDPYLDLAREWTDPLWRHALDAHVSGDDRTCLARCRQLDHIRRTVDVEAAERGFTRPHAADGKPLHFLGDFPELAALIADQERRAKEAGRTKRIEGKADLDKLPDAAARVAALVRDLDQVGVRGTTGGLGWPEPADVAEHPIVRALIAEGDAAVEPLIACMETDTRLSRSESEGEIHPVADVAWKTLCETLRFHFHGNPHRVFDNFPGTTALRRDVAAQVRACWRKVKDLSGPERLFAMLADDGAPHPLQVEAAMQIVFAERDPYSLYDYTTRWTHPGQEKPPNPNEILRKRTDPSVADLIAKRMEEVLEDKRQYDTQSAWNVRSAGAMGLALAKWTRDDKAEDLRRTATRLQKLFKDAPFGRGSGYHFLHAAVDLSAALMSRNDEEAFTDYAEWVKTVSPFEVRHEEMALLAPLAHHPNHPVMIATAAWLFEDAKSPWAKLLDAETIPYAVDQLYESALLANPAFRKRVLRDLDDKRVAGTIGLEKTDVDYLVVDYKDRGRRTVALDADAGPLRASEVKRDLRKCDHLAWQLSKIYGSPRCELYWTEAQCDAAIARMKTFLQKYGHRIEPPREDYGFWPSPSLMVTFPSLARPATAADAAKGDAFYTLAGEGQVRVPDPPIKPMLANWTTLKGYPYKVVTTRGSGEVVSIETRYRRDGVIFQPEEVLVDGRWKRYYTFVSKYRIDRVPAEEIILDEEPLLSDGRTCRIGIKGVEQWDEISDPEAFKPGKPLIVQLSLVNLSGADCVVPTTYVRPGPAGIPVLRSGIDVKLLWVPLALGDREDLGNVTWVEDFQEFYEGVPALPVPPRAVLHFNSTEMGKTLRPAEEFAAFELDLSKLFDTSRPGHYVVQVIFSAKDSGFTDGKSECITVRLPMRVEKW